MTELKTLRDIEEACPGLHPEGKTMMVHSDNLRKNAISYYRQYDIFYKKSMKSNNFHSYPNAGEVMCVMEFLKLFFNLSEGDLK